MADIYLSPQEAAKKLDINLLTLKHKIAIGELEIFCSHRGGGDILCRVDPRYVNILFEEDKRFDFHFMPHDCDMSADCQYYKFMFDRPNKGDLFGPNKKFAETPKAFCAASDDLKCLIPLTVVPFIPIRGVDDISAICPAKFSELLILQSGVDALLSKEQQVTGKNVSAQNLANDRHAPENQRINGIAEIVSKYIECELKRIRDSRSPYLQLIINHTAAWSEAVAEHGLAKEDKEKVLKVVKKDTRFKGIEFLARRPRKDDPIISIK